MQLSIPYPLFFFFLIQQSITAINSISKKFRRLLLFCTCCKTHAGEALSPANPSSFTAETQPDCASNLPFQKQRDLLHCNALNTRVAGCSWYNVLLLRSCLAPDGASAQYPSRLHQPLVASQISH